MDKKEKITFGYNLPQTITLDTDPSMVEGKIGQYDNKFYTYFTTDDRVFFATPILHSKLLNVKKGDEVVITKKEQESGNGSYFELMKDGEVLEMSKKTLAEPRHIPDGGTTTLGEIKKTVNNIESMLTKYLNDNKENKKEDEEEDLGF